jgi:hypothetical protein
VRRRGGLGGGSEARAENVEQIVSRLRSRGVQVIMLENQTLLAVPTQYHQPDGQHLTPEGYRLLASWFQRNIISERVLKMPRERTGDTDKPFKDVPRNTVA